MTSKRKILPIAIGLVVCSGFRTAQLLFLQDADGYLYEWARPLVPLPLVLCGAVIFGCFLLFKEPPVLSKSRVPAIFFFIAALAVIADSAIMLISSSAETPLLFLFKKAASALEWAALANLRLSVLCAVFVVFAAAFFIKRGLDILKGKAEHGAFLTAACIIYLWLRLLREQVLTPTNAFDAEKLCAALSLLIISVAFAAFFSPTSGERLSRALCTGGFIFSLGLAAVELVALLLSGGAPVDTVPVISRAAVAVCALLLPITAKNTLRKDSSEDEKND